MPKDSVSPQLRRLGARVRELREARKLTQQALSRRSGVSRPYLSGVERGIRNLTVLHLLALAKALRVEPHELLPPRT